MPIFFFALENEYFSIFHLPFFTGSGSGVFNNKRFRDVERDLDDLFDGVALGGREAPVFSPFEVVDVGVFAGELGEPGPLRS